MQESGIENSYVNKTFDSTTFTDNQTDAQQTMTDQMQPDFRNVYENCYFKPLPDLPPSQNWNEENVYGNSNFIQSSLRGEQHNTQQPLSYQAENASNNNNEENVYGNIPSTCRGNQLNTQQYMNDHTGNNSDNQGAIEMKNVSPTTQEDVGFYDGLDEENYSSNLGYSE